MADKYPTYFLFSIVIYFIAFLYGIRFVLAGFTQNLLGSWDFYLISAIILLPLLFLILHNLNEKSMLLWKRANLLRHISFVLMVISTVFIALVIIPISI
ncbi:MAG: hypothetical protein HY832_01970 [Candidatus Aenigmarchaeota archaeon]|nr:hypothetical protein [Candidatus Aenigmarchaeota archaeon]